LGIGRGVVHSAEFTHYGGDEVLPDVRETARRLAKEAGIRKELMEKAGVSERAFAYWLSGDRDPRPERLAALASVIAESARGKLLQADPFGTAPKVDEDAIAAFLDLPEPERRCRGPECGRRLVGRQRDWCSEACRKRAERSEQARLF
jgi:transcriptional regulator with XRE-family HTH domain